MSNLNSLVVEGNVVGDVQSITDWQGTPAKAFKLRSTRFYKDEAGRHEEVSEFIVEVKGPLGDTCEQYLSEGKGVRVIGRVESRPSIARFVLHGEHVEFRSGGR